ncbi:MAG: UDP-glucose 4-epimerase GalE [Candidatus Woesebacteria bacterium]|nr:UDP-glucose 4-epimerase GalE [Candidatus Woesebacteria bacterium]
MKVLVTGGAGYIGSFMTRKLKEDNHEVVILDNLSNGHIEAVKDFRLEKLDLVDEKQKLDEFFISEKFDAVIHMAGFIQMGESFTNPSKYYHNNVIGFLNLVDVMVKNNCKKIILSSSAGVYGNPIKLPVEENDPKNPLNPYGETKYIMERILDDYDLAYGLKYVSFRYFNAAGAALDGSIGEAHPEESHLIPNIISKALKGEEVEIFGNDYDTSDGTCVRDYIHVLDLVEAHAMGLKVLEEGKISNIYNIGIGKGYSNKEVIKMVEKIGNLKVNVKFGPRRDGDADSLYASNAKIKKELGWNPKYTLEDIIKTAYEWHKKTTLNLWTI